MIKRAGFFYPAFQNLFFLFGCLFSRFFCCFFDGLFSAFFCSHDFFYSFFYFNFFAPLFGVAFLNFLCAAFAAEDLVIFFIGFLGVFFLLCVLSFFLPNNFVIHCVII